MGPEKYSKEAAPESEITDGEAETANKAETADTEAEIADTEAGTKAETAGAEAGTAGTEAEGIDLQSGSTDLGNLQDHGDHLSAAEIEDCNIESFVAQTPVTGIILLVVAGLLLALCAAFFLHCSFCKKDT